MKSSFKKLLDCTLSKKEFSHRAVKKYSLNNHEENENVSPADFTENNPVFSEEKDRPVYEIPVILNNV